MDKKEQEILEQLKSKAEDIKVPEALEPVQIEQMLQGKKQKRRFRGGFTAAIAAACVLAACGLIYGVWKIPGKNSAEMIGQGGQQSAGNSEAKAAGSYEEIYRYLERYQNEMGGAQDGAAVQESVTDSSMPGSTAGAGEVKSTPYANLTGEDQKQAEEYSETNSRQAGVDEADTLKTDGRYLFMLEDNGRALAIVDTDGQTMKKAGAIQAQDDWTITEFYVKDEKVVLICTQGTGGYGVMPLNDQATAAGIVMAATYDVSNAQSPEKLGEVTQSGYYTSSRMEGNHLYLFSEYAAETTAAAAKTDSYIPAVNGALIEQERIYLPVTDAANIFEVVTSVSLDKPDETADSKAIFTKGGQYYVSNENIYWYEQSYGTDVKTTIRKLSYQEGRLEIAGQCELDGYINDSFSIDEYNGYLRIVSTDNDTNGVYIYDESLKLTGSIEGLAEDERVYSARFMGDTAYFVTFRETDPLFTVDLSDPEAPEIVGELKIPGFSEYLHFYGDHMLLGIGMDVNEGTGITGGVKLTMFDISDRTDVKESQTYVMENVFGADVLNDYKAALIDKNKNMIGFSAYEGGNETYYLFSYDENNGFECRLKEAVNGSGNQATRSVYIEDTVYVVKGNVIEAYSLETWKKSGDLIL